MILSVKSVCGGSNEHDLLFHGSVARIQWQRCVAVVSGRWGVDVMSRLTAIICAVVICLLVSMGWAVSHYRDNAITYKEQRDTVTHKLTLANETITDMMKRQRDVAALDARYTKELADANATIESLRADVSAGRKRLQVAATCAKSTTGSSGMGDGESPRLTADAELNYYRLRSGIDRITAQVNYLQEYIRSQCLK